ncbi:MAG TPA: hypothetical protein VN732_11040 [Solirubrobacterales bacterium]|nr:hypothetical protein [Solirubrobacterales bacterium]
MKYLKTTGLTALLLAGVLLAPAGASATTAALCKVNSTPCGAGNYYEAGQAIKSVLESGSKVVFDAGFYKVECTASSISGKVLKKGVTEVAVVTLETVSFEGCGCGVKTLKPGTMSVTWVNGTMNGKLTTAGIEVSIPCMSPNCVYGEGPFGTLTGGAMATIHASGFMNRVKGEPIPCPATITWEAGYTVTTPEPLWVSES